MTNSVLQKASLQPFRGETAEAEAIELMFNPTQLAFARTVKWQPEQGGRSQKSALPKVNFSGVEPYKLTLNQLVFDTYEEDKLVIDKDKLLVNKDKLLVDKYISVVDKYIKKLKKGVEAPDGQNKRPPVYILMWGDKSSFPCVITSLSYKLDMFMPDGTPVRALVDISLQEVDMDNPPGTSESKSKGADRSGGDSRQARQRGGRQPLPSPSPSNPSDF